MLQTVILVLHLMIAVGLVAVVLLQRSEGGALGIGGGGGGGLFSGRGTANLLTRSTAVLGGCFFATSVMLTLLAQHSGPSGSLLNQPAAPVTAPGVAAKPGDPLPPLSAPAATGGVLGKLQQGQGGAPLPKAP